MQLAWNNKGGLLLFEMLTIIIWFVNLRLHLAFGTGSPSKSQSESVEMFTNYSSSRCYFCNSLIRLKGGIRIFIKSIFYLLPIEQKNKQKKQVRFSTTKTLPSRKCIHIGKIKAAWASAAAQHVIRAHSICVFYAQVCNWPPIKPAIAALLLTASILVCTYSSRANFGVYSRLYFFFANKYCSGTRRF